jgi:hypothetical protein
MEIAAATIRYYRDNRQLSAIIDWSDGSQTVGNGKFKPSCFLLRRTSIEFGTHMDQLLQRAEREGIAIRPDRL